MLTQNLRVNIVRISQIFGEKIQNARNCLAVSIDTLESLLNEKTPHDLIGVSTIYKKFDAHKVFATLNQRPAPQLCAEFIVEGTRIYEGTATI
jgi:hypothetical protein